MEPARGVPLPPSPSLGSVARSMTKILRLRHSTGGFVCETVDAAPDEYALGAAPKLKPSLDLGDFSGVLADPPGYVFCRADDEKQQQKEGCGAGDREAIESLLAILFARISAVKAAYAQLQVAQLPYNPDKIQSADAAVVAGLSRISEVKKSYFRNQFDPSTSADADAAQLLELRSLVKTYKISIGKLEAELGLKKSEIAALRDELLESQRKASAFESKLHPKRTLAALHLSALSPTHFLTALRHAYKSIKSFVDLMANEMESAGWDLRTAAGSIQSDVLHRKNPGHWTFAFESYVCRRMFSGFHRQSFGFPALGQCSDWDPRRFFDEFSKTKSMATNQTLGRTKSLAAEFCRAKYLSLVHPKMQSSFFGDLHQMAKKAGTGGDFMDSQFFRSFAEMARRVWLLHCLFFSFDPAIERSIFQLRRGTRFSELYMESVTEAPEDEEDAGAGEATAAVGFTVVPGFRLHRTVIQCRVYVISCTGTVDGTTLIKSGRHRRLM